MLSARLDTLLWTLLRMIIEDTLTPSPTGRPFCRNATFPTKPRRGGRIIENCLNYDF